MVARLNMVKAFRKRMQFLRAAKTEQDLRNWKALHFEKLKGQRKDERSVRLNDQWRLFETQASYKWAADPGCRNNRLPLERPVKEKEMATRQRRANVAEVFPPGEFIREELEARGWTQGDLCNILRRPLQTINEIINGKKEITPDTAIALGEAFRHFC